MTFRGELTEYESETHEELVTQVGEGITGYAAISGAMLLRARRAPTTRAGWQIEGTDEIDETLLAVPLKVGDRVTGVIVLSHLGIDQFDEEDQRVLEVLASHASVAYENASLLQKEREAAKTASALLGLSQALSGAGNVSSVLARVVAAVPSIIDGSVVVAVPARPQERRLRTRAPSEGSRRPVARHDPRRARERLPRVLGRALRDRTRRGRTGAEEFWLTDEPAAALSHPR